MDNNSGKSFEKHGKVPFVKSLPADSKSHFEILTKAEALVLRSGMVTLKPGDNVGSHNTEDYEECIIVLEGSGEIEVEGLGRQKITARQAAYNPPHTQHNVYNTGDHVMRYIYIVAKTK
jgi:quercetin dioxygenase-like cupin family protein